MNPIQMLQQEFCAFRSEVPLSMACWETPAKIKDVQLKAIQNFSQCLAQTAKKWPTLNLDRIQSYWNKVCSELIQEQISFTDKFAGRVNCIHRLLQEQQMPTSNDATEPLALLAFDLHQGEVKWLDTPWKETPRWVASAKTMLTRVMQGHYGRFFRQKIMVNKDEYVHRELTRLIMVDRMLCGKDPLKDCLDCSCPPDEIQAMARRIRDVSEGLFQKGALAQECINEILIKDKSLFPASLKKCNLRIGLHDELWEQIRVYFSPSDIQLCHIARLCAQNFPEKGFELACKVNTDRKKIVHQILNDIAGAELDVAMSLVQTLRSRDKPLHSSCCSLIAEKLLRRTRNLEQAMPYISEVQDDAELVSILPHIIESIANKGDACPIALLAKYVNQAKSVETQDQLVEQLLKKLSIALGEKFLDSLSNTFVKDLGFSAIIIKTTLTHSTSEHLRLYEKISAPKIRQDTLELLVLNKYPRLEEMAKLMKDESGRLSLLQKMAEHSRALSPDLLNLITNKRARILIQQFLKPEGRG